MSEGVVCFADFHGHRRGWSNSDRAVLYRAEGVLRRLGLSLETLGGVTDEDDPWFVFCDADTDEVIVHFSKIHGEGYVVCAPLLSSSLSGSAFADLVERFLDRYTAATSPRTTDGAERVNQHRGETLVTRRRAERACPKGRPFRSLRKSW